MAYFGVDNFKVLSSIVSCKLIKLLKKLKFLYNLVFLPCIAPFFASLRYNKCKRLRMRFLFDVEAKSSIFTMISECLIFCKMKNRQSC